MQAAVEDKQAGKLNKIAKVTAESVKLTYFKWIQSLNFT